MKCDKCEETAVFHYRAFVNGEISERHLCGKCAREEGLTGAMLKKSLLPDMFGFGGMFNYSPFGRRMLSSYGESGAYGSPVVLEETIPETAAALIPEDAGEEFRQKRELTILRNQMQAAVKSEDFEKAADLRDRIREMEKIGGTNKG